MIRMTNVTKVYRRGLLETHALSGFTLHVARGEFLSVMGPSGSGKTTFLNVAGLLDPFDGGEYLLDGEPMQGLSDARASAIRNRKIGFVFQSFQLIADLDVFDNVEVPLRVRGLGARARRDRVERALADVGLSARLHHLPGELSGGQQQRVAIARALVGEPALLLADEPTGNLDSRSARQILDLLERIHAGGTTIVMTTHDPELAARARRKVHVLDGKLIDPWALAAPAASSVPAPAIAPTAPAAPADTVAKGRP
ncbi:ABC transporter ATP-binding protein [Sorangium cellulosum]|uniref:ABC transporter ATP-binding protein n=1 Tax=Sorangium cellulosum TaxID=56 RepID=A0A2L0ETJ5_SORCE|nr:ABC transporter ATP-binding protein [Sorangium cellulosum]AUX42605.1 ABC transporter ATP-binding protein [Sorangium cellulosum]